MTYYGLYEEGNRLFDKGKINYGEYVKMIEPLNNEVRKAGKWVEWRNDGIRIYANCNECGGAVSFSTRKTFEYCPYCGAKMERSE